MKKIFLIIILIILLVIILAIGYETFAYVYNENINSYYNEHYLDRAYIKDISDIDEYVEEKLESNYRVFNSLSEVKEFFASLEADEKITNTKDANKQFEEIRKLEYVESVIYSLSLEMGQQISEEVIKRPNPIYVGIYSNSNELYHEFYVKYDKIEDENDINIKLINAPILSENKAQSYIIICPLKDEEASKNIILSTQKSEEVKEYIPSFYWNLRKSGTQPLAKPIIYIYPEVETNVIVSLSNPEKLTHTYPKYDSKWNVLAKPNGDLLDLSTNRNLYCLYWESIDDTKIDMSEGFIVKGEDTTSFLEEKLKILGLSDREANEFIIYWLPKLESSKYNYIRFRTIDEINSYMKLNINPEPDTLIRVVMDFKNLDEPVKVNEQKLQSITRKGYTVVEWGARELI